MFVQPLRPSDPAHGSQAQRAQDTRVAVLLNANARKVSEKVIKSLSHVVPHEDLFVSRSMIDARRIAQTVIERRYPTVFIGGGDGSFMAYVNEILKQLELRNQYHFQKAPRFGVLKLGTGNAIASCVKASPLKGDKILDDVLRARAGEVPGYRDLELLEVDGRRAQFAGLGVDAKMINDQAWAKRNFRAGNFKLSGPAAYFWGIALRTAPHYIAHSAMAEVEVTNGGKGPAYRLDRYGQQVGEPIAPGESMYRGQVILAAAATIPYAGYEFHAYPFAGKRRGMFHFRLASLKTVEVITHLPSLWKGTWFPEGLKDWYASEVKVKFDRPMPYEIAGDPEGERDEMTFAMSPDRVELVDFTGAVH